MAGRNFLFVPGPTNMPDRILRAMHLAMEDHRSSDFPTLAAPVFEDLKKVFKTTSGQPFIFPASGTGAWEASLSNTLSPGDRVLAARFGMFSHLWIDMAQRLGLEVEVLDAEWGEGAPIERYQEALAADGSHGIKAVLFTHNETATGVTSDVAGIRRRPERDQAPGTAHGGWSELHREYRLPNGRVGCGPGRYRVPEGLHAAGRTRHRLRQPESARSLRQARLPRVFFDFGDMRKANTTGYFPYTPSIPMLYGLKESVAMLLEEGLENVYARHHRLAEGTRLAVKAWGLELCARAPKWNSDTVTAIMVPPGINGAEVIDVAYRRYNLALGAGLARMAGRLFRIGHLGDLNELMLLGALAGSEMAMRDVGMKVTPGQRSGRGAGILAKHVRAPRSKRELPPRAPEAQPASPDPRRSRSAPGDEPHPLRAGASPASAQRARGARLPAGNVSQGAGERG